MVAVTGVVTAAGGVSVVILVELRPGALEEAVLAAVSRAATEGLVADLLVDLAGVGSAVDLLVDLVVALAEDLPGAAAVGP